MSGWNFADVWEMVARRLPHSPALIHGRRTVDWQSFTTRADGIATALLDAGLARQDKVAQYLFNSPEYLESLFATWKAALVPVNTNYRYVATEIAGLWENADVTAVVFHASLADTAAAVRPYLPGIRLWLWVDDLGGTGECPTWARPYEAAAASGEHPTPPWSRSGDDLWLVYTGGTTGAPKGVMWRQDDLVRVLNGRAAVPLPVESDLGDVEAMITAPGPIVVIASPLMHAAAQVRAFPALSSGGAVVTLEGRRFDAAEVLEAIACHRATALAVVGDAFGQPLVDALDATPDRWDISSLRTISSSGALFSETVVRGLLRHNPAMTVVDVVGASEAMGVAYATWTKDSTFGAGTFVPSSDTRVLDDGRLARRGNIPLGYYKDPERTAATFPTIDGERWAVPGDYAAIEADGTIRLFGRGATSINTAGEKVWPEEVEAVIKELPEVADVAVVGTADRRTGEAVTAVVVVAPGTTIDERTIVEHVKGRLAGYKAPRRVHFTDDLERHENGKINHGLWKERLS